jgi:hypothetical protein
MVWEVITPPWAECESLLSLLDTVTTQNLD